jgi:hypothetical protein
LDGDEPVARPLPTHKHRINADIHALIVDRTRYPSVRASEDSSCLRPRGHCDRLASEGAKTLHALDRSASVRASEDSSCLRPGGHCDRPLDT